MFIWTDFTHWSGVSIVDFEQVNSDGNTLQERSESVQNWKLMRLCGSDNQHTTVPITYSYQWNLL